MPSSTPTWPTRAWSRRGSPEGDWARRERGRGADLVTSLTHSGTTATVNIFGHDFTAGDRVLISGADQPQYNGLFTVASPRSDSFTMTVAGTPASPATGRIICRQVVDNGASGWSWFSAADAFGSSLELKKPGTPTTNEVPYILVEHVHYVDGLPWPEGADGTGYSIQRVNEPLFGNDPAHWTAAAPTPGPQAAPVDSDGDGMPNAWEETYGFDPFNPADAALDSDADGLTNVQEYQAGTNPRDRQSILRFEAIALAPDGTNLVLRFQRCGQPDLHRRVHRCVGWRGLAMDQDRIAFSERPASPDGDNRGVPDRSSELVSGLRVRQRRPTGALHARASPTHRTRTSDGSPPPHSRALALSGARRHREPGRRLRLTSARARL